MNYKAPFKVKRIKIVNKTTGDDKISPRVLPDFGPVLAQPSCKIINKSISSGVFLSCWKSAKVIPLHKSGARDNVDNYRPISLLPIASKILEKLVHSSLYKYLNSNNLLYNNQSGFRKDHSCGACLMNIVESCYEYINKGQIIGLLALDFRKAFDVINSNILLSKLELYGCNDILLKWFKSYSFERYQRVHCSDSVSESVD